MGRARREDAVYPPRIEPYETLQPLALHPDLASFAVKDRKTGAPATLWLAEESLLLPATAPHAHLLERYAHGMRDGYEYVVTEPVHETLRTILMREGVLSSERAIAVALGVARGLSQLLMVGIPVGHITAADVAVGPDGTPKVIPFSLPLEEAGSGDAGLLASLGGLYCEMLMGRRPRADDPLAAASTEILRGLVTSSLARERVGQRPEPAAMPVLPPAPDLAARMPPLTTILRWSGVAAAVAVVAIVMGVQASMRPVTVPAPRTGAPVAAPAPVVGAPRIVERLPVPQRHERSAVRPTRKRRTVAKAPAARRPALATAATTTVSTRLTSASSARALSAARKAALRATWSAPQRTARPAPPMPLVVATRPRALYAPVRTLRTTRAGLGRYPRPAPRIAMAQVPSAIPPRERVLGEPPAVFRDDAPGVRHAPRAAGEARAPSVRLKVVLDAEGRPETAFVVRSSGDPRADQAAVRAAKDMRFDPPRSGDAEGSGGRGGVTYTTLAVPNADFPGLAHPVSGLR
jgi:TonB family protein